MDIFVPITTWWPVQEIRVAESASLREGADFLASTNAAVPWLSWDVAALISIVVALFIFGIMGGRERLLSLLVALYAAAAISRSLPAASDAFLAWGIMLPPPSTLIVFLGMWGLLTFLLGGDFFAPLFKFSRAGLSSLWQVAVLSVLIGGFFVSLVLQFVPFGWIEPSAFLNTFFRHGIAPLAWAALPVIFLIFLKVEDLDEN